MIHDFLHISITCRDLERTIRFYEALGLKTIKRFGEVQEQGIADAFRLPTARLAVAYLAASTEEGRMFIDLVQWLDPAAAGEAYPALNNVGLNRFALRVSDMDATIAAAKDRGVTFLTDEPQSVGDEGMRFIVATDPDGVFVQLIEGF
ncbi:MULTISPECIES: VOC family protein [unclassified Sphingomonas]|uniref:VOC family protein n=1 Tax=unclassified Sphingomonas TaxID=196159 RepID=UPI0006F30C34|nr:MULTISPECIES: VOC family protein [unclassified Sphingomonas]KQN18556.1 hypothetical protein ASE83_09775 [Sphingomonas sp. Leaf32]